MMQFKRTGKLFNHKLISSTLIWLCIKKRFLIQSKGERSVQFTSTGSCEHFFMQRYLTSIETFQQFILTENCLKNSECLNKTHMQNVLSFYLQAMNIIFIYITLLKLQVLVGIGYITSFDTSKK